MRSASERQGACFFSLAVHSLFSRARRASPHSHTPAAHTHARIAPVTMAYHPMMVRGGAAGGKSERERASRTKPIVGRPVRLPLPRSSSHVPLSPLPSSPATPNHPAEGGDRHQPGQGPGVLTKRGRWTLRSDVAERKRAGGGGGASVFFPPALSPRALDRRPPARAPPTSLPPLPTASALWLPQHRLHPHTYAHAPDTPTPPLSPLSSSPTSTPRARSLTPSAPRSGPAAWTSSSTTTG